MPPDAPSPSDFHRAGSAGAPAGAALLAGPEDGFFPQLWETMNDAVIVLDAGLFIRAYNPAAEKLFGYPAAVVLGKRLSLLDRPMVSPEGDELDAEHSPVTDAVRTGRATGPTLIGLTDAEYAVQWVRVRATPLVDAGGVTRVIVTYENVTAQRAAESEAALNGQIIRQAADAILICDARGLVLRINPAFTRLTGFAEKDIVGGVLRLLEHRERDRTVFGQLMEALRNGDIWSNRIAHRRRDGGAVDCIGTLSPLYGAGTVPDGFVYMLRDMSHIADMERRMMNSQKMEAIGTLAGGIAHDFNNLLHSISGYAELSVRETHSTRVRTYLANVLAACDRAEGLVRQILTFSRREERERRAVLVGDELAKSVDFVRVTLPASVQVTAEFDCAGACVLGDPTELQQVVINLLTNAYQSLPGRSGRIGLVARVVEITPANRGSRASLTFGHYVEIVVSDTGKGIPPGVMERIFEPFFTTKAVNEGTGMGLSIVHGVVSSMQGDISVKSHVGSGTCFTILLPLAVAGTNPGIVVGAARPERGAERVLVVDDEIGITGMVFEMLTTLGYRVTTRNSWRVGFGACAVKPSGFRHRHHRPEHVGTHRGETRRPCQWTPSVSPGAPVHGQRRQGIAGESLGSRRRAYPAQTPPVAFNGEYDPDDARQDRLSGGRKRPGVTRRRLPVVSGPGANRPVVIRRCR